MSEHMFGVSRSKMSAQAERIKRAACCVDATQISPRRWAYYADETSTWWVVSGRELGELCDYMDDEDVSISRDAYSHWCAGSTAREMPRGWGPE